MKKLVFCVLFASVAGVIGWQHLEISRLKDIHQKIDKLVINLNTLRKDEHKEVQVSYVSNDIELKPLPEPEECKKTDILNRIEVLRQHIIYNPDKKWLSDVLGSAKNEIVDLRQ